MSHRLLIIGAGGFGREVLAWARDAASVNPEWEIAGFLDRNPAALDGYHVGVGIVGDPENYIPQPDDRFLCAIGDPATRLHVCRDIESRGGVFTSLIHPSVIIGPDTTFGKGLIACPFVGISCNVTLGDFVTINGRASIGHDAIIGDGCMLNGHSEVDGWAVLDEGAFLGSHAVVMPRVKVGAYAKIGAGSVAMRKVPPRVTVMGVPAKKIWGADDADTLGRAA